LIATGSRGGTTAASAAAITLGSSGRDGWPCRQATRHDQQEVAAERQCKRSTVTPSIVDADLTCTQPKLTADAII